MALQEVCVCVCIHTSACVVISGESPQLHGSQVEAIPETRFPSVPIPAPSISFGTHSVFCVGCEDLGDTVSSLFGPFEDLHCIRMPLEQKEAQCFNLL